MTRVYGYGDQPSGCHESRCQIEGRESCVNTQSQRLKRAAGYGSATAAEPAWQHSGKARSALVCERGARPAPKPRGSARQCPSQQCLM